MSDRTRKHKRVFLASTAGLLDVMGALVDWPSDDEYEAMSKDWEQVGDDLRSAMREAKDDLTPEQRASLDEALVTIP